MADSDELDILHVLPETKKIFSSSSSCVRLVPRPDLRVSALSAPVGGQGLFRIGGSNNSVGAK